MRISLLSLCLALLLATPLYAQQPVPASDAARQLTPTQGVSSNFIQVLDAVGDSLWTGPLLTVYLENEDRFLTSDAPALEQDNVVFALDADPASGTGSTVWAGLAFGTDAGGTASGGYLVSNDGGETFAERFPPVDEEDDTTVSYGANTLDAIPVTREEDVTPQAVEFDPATGTAWTAVDRGGIRRSDDGGETWRRVVLPPDTLDAIAPDASYDFLLAPPQNDGTGSLNHLGFSVLVDATGTVWAGTAGGVNRSRPEDVAANGRAWTRASFDGTPGSLTGNLVAALGEEPRPGRNRIWMATWAVDGGQGGPRQRFGITVTEDGGATFRQALVGAQVFDFAFRDGRVYAASGSGLLVSDDGGRTWASVRDFPLQNPDRFFPNDAGVRAVETTDSGLWVGTSDGLLRLARADEAALLGSGSLPRWQLFRTDVPVNPEEPSDAAPDVATYAYPNPFSPDADGVIRIVFEQETAGPVDVEIYDFSMNRVRSLSRSTGSGQQEIVWDGRDAGGLRLPNGPYFYTVETTGETVRGKILLVE